MKRQIISVFIFLLTSCSAKNISSLTDVSIPTIANTFVLSPATTTKEIAPITMTPSPLPAKFTITIIAPNYAQLQNWKDYETALAKIYISFLPPEQVLCEWDILGQVEDELYVWALCMSTVLIGNTGYYSATSIPAVIHLNSFGEIQKIEIPGINSDYVTDTIRMFPKEVREKFDVYHFGRAKEMSEHIEYRRNNPDVPPSIVLITTQMP